MIGQLNSKSELELKRKSDEIAKILDGCTISDATEIINKVKSKIHKLRKEATDKAKFKSTA